MFMIAGTAYGVALNHKGEALRLASAFTEAPYKAPPVAPVVYIKPRNCFSAAGAPVPLPADLAEVALSPTLALLFGRDACRVDAEDALKAVDAACLAIDVSEPLDNYYRPAIRQLCRDGFLPLGRFGGLPALDAEIVTAIDGVEAQRWSLADLVRPVGQLIADLSSFMTLKAGDLLLVGTADNPPRATAGQRVDVTMAGMAPLTVRIEKECRP
jgi:5-oxopent-3-ene-1,2,5-tricarboxylate decarboxylase/2-hydroxyhepta-2,4-diene-1,7-dioate isomerase